MDLLGANGSGIFNLLDSYDIDQTTPILTDILAQYKTLDMDYHVGYSADKYISPSVYKCVEKALDTRGFTIEDLIAGNLDVSDLELLVEDVFEYDTTIMPVSFDKIIYNRFATKWVKIWNALNTAYNPLENYDMTQTETPDITKTRSVNTDVTEERKVNTDLTTSTDADVTDTDIYGFNSSSPNPSGKITRNGDVVVTGDADDNVETTHTTGDSDDNVTTETESGTRGLTRHGNIGVTTSQQMLQSELEVRKYDFYKMIYNDIDSILCLKVY